MNSKRFKIIQVLSHNIILCQSISSSKHSETYIFFGKGVGFKKKSGDFFEYDSSVSNGLLVLEPKEAAKYKEILSTVQNEKLVEVVQEVTDEANKFFNGQVNAKLNITLLDHLNFAITRKKNNIIFSYPFLDELRFIYPKEFLFAKNALEYINNKLNDITIFDESELGFLILHIHAAIKNTKVSTVLFNNEILYLCTNLIEDSINEKVDKESIYYSRFCKHLEFAIKRAKENISLKNVLLSTIIEKCSFEFDIAKKIADLLQKKYKVTLDENEIGYLSLHIYNLRNKNFIS